jgi:hypothetical protein
VDKIVEVVEVEGADEADETGEVIVRGCVELFLFEQS